MGNPRRNFFYKYCDILLSINVREQLDSWDSHCHFATKFEFSSSDIIVKISALIRSNTEKKNGRVTS